MFTLQSASVAVNPTAFLPFAAQLSAVSPADAERDRLEADYAEYSAWLDANADEMAAEAEAYELYEMGLPTW